MKPAIVAVALALAAPPALAQGGFAATIDFSKIKRCSAESPEIVLAAVPAGTTLIEVSLYDQDAPRYNHGGGKAAYDGSGVIRAGAVKGNYDGPCPPYPHTYEYTVTARDKDGKALGEATVKGEFPPSKK